MCIRDSRKDRALHGVGAAARGSGPTAAATVAAGVLEAIISAHSQVSSLSKGQGISLASFYDVHAGRGVKCREDWCRAAFAGISELETGFLKQARDTGCGPDCSPRRGNADLRSIRAPLAGCDCCGDTSLIWLKHFNPRTPRGVRQVQRENKTYSRLISIHAPLAGCDGVPKHRR